MLKNIFSSKELDEFAKTLAQSLAKRYPPSLEATPARRISVNRVSRVLEEILERVSEYGSTHKLGVYKKARLGNSFRWELKDLGYSEKFTELATEGLIIYLSRKPADKAAEKSASQKRAK